MFVGLRWSDISAPPDDHEKKLEYYKMNNDRADGHCYSFAWIFKMILDVRWPYFSFQKQILFTIISTLSKNEQKLNVGG